MKVKKYLVITLGFLIGLISIYEIALYLFFDRNPSYFQIDRCMDSGGCWDGIDKVCRNSEPNAQQLCDRFKIKGKSLEGRVKESIDKINPDR